MRTVEFRDREGLCAWAYLEAGGVISGDCVPGNEHLIFTILNDYDILDGQRISATSHPVDWFERLPKKYFRSAVLNAFEVDPLKISAIDPATIVRMVPVRPRQLRLFSDATPPADSPKEPLRPHEPGR